MVEQRACPICHKAPRMFAMQEREGVFFGLECVNPACTSKAAPLYFPSPYAAIEAWNERIDYGKIE